MDEFKKFDLVLDENIRIDADPWKNAVHIHACLLLLAGLLIKIDLNVREVVL